MILSNIFSRITTNLTTNNIYKTSNSNPSSIEWEENNNIENKNMTNVTMNPLSISYDRTDGKVDTDHAIDIEAIGQTDIKQLNENEIKTSIDNNTLPSSNILLLPMKLRLLFSLFYFIYVGIEMGFGGWIASYVILQDLTSSTSDAAYITSIFYGFLALGRICAIPMAIFISTTTMLRIQLSLSVICGIILLSLAHQSYNLAVTCAALLGFSLSSLFPLVMTLVSDYGFTMYVFISIYIYFCLLFDCYLCMCI
jgi:hypothetical protein